MLRHNPEKIGLEIGEEGWVCVDELIENSTMNNMFFTMEELIEVVETNDKQRFSFNEDKTSIRASQGHSVKVDLKLKALQPPFVLYHGTVDDALDSISRDGLVKMNRQHVHLSEDITTATAVGSRRGKPIILHIEAKEMYNNGYKFYKSDNGVWLTDNVPIKYINRLK